MVSSQPVRSEYVARTDLVRALINGAAATDPAPLVIGGRTLASRLLVGTGKFSSSAVMGQVVEASAAEVVTVALRRIDLRAAGVADQDPVSVLDLDRVVLLPNTSGARDAEEAVRLARLARSMGAGDWVKLEVTPEPTYLLPDPVETLKAASILAKEGFVVLPYMNADPILALRLQDAGCAAVMPLGSPIGTGQGLRTRDAIRIILEQARVPVIVDAGIGAPSQAAEAMEMGAAAVLVNTALAVARHPVAMAEAFALAVLAGRSAFCFGRAARSGEAWNTASASGPLTGFLRGSDAGESAQSPAQTGPSGSSRQ